MHTMTKCLDPITNSLKLIGGKWKIAIIYNLGGGAVRFGELKRKLSPITQLLIAYRKTGGVLRQRPFRFKHELLWYQARYETSHSFNCTYFTAVNISIFVCRHAFTHAADSAHAGISTAHMLWNEIKHFTIASISYS
jgi:hypothetical protein